MRKKEDALLEDVDKYRELVANANCIMIRMEQNGRITFFNKYAQKFFGYDEDEILGDDIKILVPQIESDGKNLGKMIDQLLRSPDDFEENIHENIRKNGERVWVSWRNRAIRDADGKVIGNLALGRDITRHKITLDALTASEMRYRRLFETAQDGILILNAETGQILNANPFLMDMLGYSHEDLLGRKLCEIGVFPDEVTFEELRDRGYAHYDDLELETKEGRHITVEFVSNVHLVDKNKVIQCNIHDITERKQIADALQKKLMTNWNSALKNGLPNFRQPLPKYIR